MEPSFKENGQQGKIICPTPGCGHKLGAYSHFGQQCSCTKFVCPAYQIHKTNVDEVKVPTLDLDIRKPINKVDWDADQITS